MSSDSLHAFVQDMWPWDDRLLTCSELAERLRLKPSTIRLWTRQGKIPVVRLGTRAVRYRQREVERALQHLSGKKESALEVQQ